MAIYTMPDSYTKLLMHADDVNGSTTFTDHSDSPHTITRDASVDHDSGNKVFGASGIYIPKANRLQIADSTDWQFGTSDFTIDFWSKGWSTTDTWGLFTYFLNASNRYHLTNYSNLEFYCNRAGSSQNLSFTNTRDLLWHHYAVVLSGTHLSIYIDGIKKGENTSFTQDIDFTGGTFYIGTRTDNGSDFSTYSAITSIDEFRVSKGIARWTSNFTPPSKPYNKIDDDYEASVAKEDSAFKITGGGTQFGGNIITRSDSEASFNDSIFTLNRKDGTGILDVSEGGTVRQGDQTGGWVQTRVYTLQNGTLPNMSTTIDPMQLDANAMYEAIYASQHYDAGAGTGGWRYVRWHGYDGSGGGGDVGGDNFHMVIVENSGTAEDTVVPLWSVSSAKARLTYGNGYVSYRTLTIRSLTGYTDFRDV